MSSPKSMWYKVMLYVKDFRVTPASNQELMGKRR